MGVLEDLTAALSTVSTGYSVFRDYMPDTPDKVIVLRETPGEAPELRIGMEKPHVQVLVRGTKAGGRTVPRNKIDDAYGALHGLAGTISTASGNYYVGIWALQSPFFLRLDENERPEYAVNFRVLRRGTST